MARKPENFEWLNFTKAQRELLESVDFYGNNGWDRNGQSDELMPKLLAECEEEARSTFVDRSLGEQAADWQVREVRQTQGTAPDL